MLVLTEATIDPFLCDAARQYFAPCLWHDPERQWISRQQQLRQLLREAVVFGDARAGGLTPLNTVSESNGDVDFGSGGPLLLPDVVAASGTARHLAVGAGKDQNIYVVDRDNMGKFNSTANNIYQEITGQLADGMWSKPSYFNNTVYFAAVTDALKAFPVTSGMLATSPSSQSTVHFGYPGATPTISANGATNGIVWAVENNTTGVLHAFNATNLASELYNSNQAANSRDQFADNKYITPVVTNGKVYVGTPHGVAVFGLLP